MSGTMPGIQTYSALKLQGNRLVAVEQLISEETSLTIYLNGKELTTMLCSPVDRGYLALGFLASEGIIGGCKDLTLFTVEDDRVLVWAEAKSGVARRIDSELRISGGDVNGYARMLEEASATHQITYGVHSGAIVANNELLYYSEDIGRHNVFDKLYGKCLEAGVSLTDKIIVFSGRVSSEVLLKVSKLGVPVIIARSVPTTLAIDLATELGITLIGAAKGDWFFVYTHADRVRL